MPHSVFILISAVAVVLGLLIWGKTKRPGPVIGVALGGFVIAALADPSMIEAGGQLVTKIFGWLSDNVFTF